MRVSKNISKNPAGPSLLQRCPQTELRLQSQPTFRLTSLLNSCAPVVCYAAVPDKRIYQCKEILHFLASHRPEHGIVATIRRLCVPKQSLSMSALRVSRAGRMFSVKPLLLDLWLVALIMSACQTTPSVNPTAMPPATSLPPQLPPPPTPRPRPTSPPPFTVRKRQKETLIHISLPASRDSGRAYSDLYGSAPIRARPGIKGGRRSGDGR